MDDRDVTVPGSVEVRRALRLDPVYLVAGRTLTSSYGLGVVLALLAVTAIVFGTATESRFIYTDF